MHSSGEPRNIAKKQGLGYIPGYADCPCKDPVYILTCQAQSKLNCYNFVRKTRIVMHMNQSNEFLHMRQDWQSLLT